MSLPHISSQHLSGFTLIEALISLTVLTLLASVGFLGSIGSYTHELAYSNQITIRLALTRARAEAINGICKGSGCTAGVDHGVYLTSSTATVFQGSSYGSRSELFDENLPLSKIIPVPSGKEVVFASLSGTVASTTTLRWSQENSSSSTQNVTVTTEGGISVSSALPQ
ncbi:prepilin-type N-terminal cleavage/methylation domain-containing protein [Patescibacteria group bacterium]|nr:prepilin-type N-terminal cleavage/methylation domain-containing protein [Patescibacteria group bacterium]